MNMACKQGCPDIRKKNWELKKHTWKKKGFYVKKHGVLFHTPIGIGKAIQQGFEEAKGRGYKMKNPYMMLDEETGLFSARMLLNIEGYKEDDPDVEVWKDAVLYSKYYKGEFKGLGMVIHEFMDYVKDKDEEIKSMYTWTTNCPECWKEQGGPTVVIFARVK